MPAPIDMTGREIGRLTVRGPADKPPGRSEKGRWWACDCECGTTVVVVPTVALRNAEKGKPDGTRSCGCLRVEAERANAVLARAAVDPGHIAALTRPVWDRTCKTCRTPFVGTARQVYCSPACRPSGSTRLPRGEAGVGANCPTPDTEVS